jgi:hypothetical protein
VRSERIKSTSVSDADAQCSSVACKAACRTVLAGPGGSCGREAASLWARRAAAGVIVRSSEGILRKARNITLGSLIEAVRDQIRSVHIKQVNRVLSQPHFRLHQDYDATVGRRDYDVPTT